MKIFVDADGCPVVNIAIEIAKEYGLEILVVKNFAHKINDSYAKVVSVDISNDSADFYIVNNARRGDILITQDYGLAAMALSKGLYPINQNGFIYTENNIEGMLNTRHIHQELRRSGKHHSKFKKRTRENDDRFRRAFKRFLEEKHPQKDKRF